MTHSMEYATVKVPRRLVIKAKPFLEENGYRSFSEFVMQAIRESLWMMYVEAHPDLPTDLETWDHARAQFFGE